MIIIVNEPDVNKLNGLAQTRVVLGKAYLDGRFPEWLARAYAHADALDVKSMWMCPLAIASGESFLDTAMALGLTADQTIEMGFCPGDGVTADELNAEWVGLLLVVNGWEVVGDQR